MIILQEKIIDTIDVKLLHQFFHEELIEYFNIKSFETLCSLETKTEYWIIDFEEKNIIPCGCIPDQNQPTPGVYFPDLLI
ncbi:MAG: hypothetical protein HYR91_12980 [Flavobacteriia bacterium]|nr:hypothetical protein [Flavobacteriia bacterium]